MTVFLDVALVRRVGRVYLVTYFSVALSVGTDYESVTALALLALSHECVTALFLLAL